MSDEIETTNSAQSEPEANQGKTGSLTRREFLEKAAAVTMGVALTTAFLEAKPAKAASPMQLAPAFPEQPSLGVPPRVFYQNTITYGYVSGAVTLASTEDGSGGFCTDDTVEIIVTRPDSSQKNFRYDCVISGGGAMPPMDVTDWFLPGNNIVKITLTDQVVPLFSSTAYYLVPGAPRDTTPPTISNVSWRQDGHGCAVVKAIIKDNVSVAAASLWWNGNAYPMQLTGLNRYEAKVCGNVNGLIGNFRITAVDPSGNIGYWPGGTLTQAERIRYTKWAGQKANTLSVGEPINSAIGNFYTQHQDLFVPATGIPFEFKRTYNSIAGGLDSPLGFGWTHNYNCRLQVVDDLLLKGVVVTFPDGRTDNFANNGSGGFTSPPGDHNQLARAGSGFVFTLADQTQYQFDASGKLTRIEDLNGNAMHFAYSGNNLTQITDTVGRIYNLTYNGSRLMQLSDVLGRACQYAYDSHGNLVTYTDPEGGAIKYTYDGEHWLLTITDPNQHTFVQNTYDARGRVTVQKDASHSVSTITYLDERTVEFKDNERNASWHKYDDELRIVEDKDAHNESITYTYDSDNNRTDMKDRERHGTHYTYDTRGNLTDVKDALGGLTHFEYNAQNRITLKRDAEDAETKYEYDTRGNLTKVIDAESGEMKMTYDARGLMQSRTDPNDHTTLFAYDAHGNLSEVADALGYPTHFEYDGVGRRTQMTDANGHTVKFAYDKNDRVKVITDPKDKTTQFVYDPVGNLKSVTDRRGFKTTYEYNENDSLVKVTDPRNFAASFTYDKMYHRKTFKNRRGFTTTYDYNQVYDLVKVTDAKTNATHFKYDADHELEQVTTAEDQITIYKHDELHRVKEMFDAINGRTGYTYDKVGRVIKRLDPKNGVTKYEYDKLGRLRFIINALNFKTEFQYDKVGNRTATIDALTHTTEFKYNAVNRLNAQVDPLGRSMMWLHDGVGNVQQLTDRRGHTTYFEYDENDNLKQVKDALGGVAAFTYDEEDHRLTTRNQNNHTTTFTYDKVGNLETVRLPLGQTTRYAYDENSNRVAMTNAKHNTTRFEFDELDLLKTQRNPLDFATQYAYDKVRRLVKLTDAEGNFTQYRYDPLDRLERVIDMLNGQTAYTYDPLGNLESHTDANNHQTEFTLDILGQVRAERNPMNNRWRYEYDGVGNRVKRIDANNQTTQYLFDQNDRLTDMQYPDPARNVKMVYDENGNLVGVSDPSGVARYAYDPLNRLSESQRLSGLSVGRTFKYDYDPASNRTKVIYPDNSVMQYAYNENEWLASADDPGPLAGVVTYERDDVGLPTLIQYQNGTATRYEYDKADRLMRLLNHKLPASTDIISHYTYEMDKVGNRTRIVEQVTRGQVVMWDKQYTYDKLYRLLKEVQTPDRNPYQVLTSEFEYDPVGNRKTMKTNIADQPNTPALPTPTTTAYTYNAANQMLMAGARQFEYDANGNRITFKGVGLKNDGVAIAYRYDFENRMIGAETFAVQPNGKLQADATLDFTYDGLGRRMERGVKEKGVRKTGQYLHDGLGYDLLAEYVEPGSPRATFYYRDPTQVLSRHEQQGNGNGLQYFHHYDGLGSVSAWTNQSGREVQAYRYAPYGRLIDNNGPDNASAKGEPHNFLTFSGKMYDKETELLYFGARDYDAGAGVWLTQDPYRGRLMEPMTLHRYGYVGGNPTNRIEYYGFLALIDDASEILAGAAIGATVNVGFQAISDLSSGHFSGLRTYTAKAASGAVTGGISTWVGINTAGVGLAIGGGAVSGGLSQITENIIMGDSWNKNLPENIVAGGIGGGLSEVLFPKVVGRKPGSLWTWLTKKHGQAKWLENIFSNPLEKMLAEAVEGNGKSNPYQMWDPNQPTFLSSADSAARSTDSVVINGTRSNSLTKSMNGGTRYPMLDLDNQVAAPSASLIYPNQFVGWGFILQGDLNIFRDIWNTQNFIPDRRYDYVNADLKCQYKPSPDAQWYDCRGGQGPIDVREIDDGGILRFIVGTLRPAPEVRFYR